APGVVGSTLGVSDFAASIAAMSAFLVSDLAPGAPIFIASGLAGSGLAGSDLAGSDLLASGLAMSDFAASDLAPSDLATSSFIRLALTTGLAASDGIATTELPSAFTVADPSVPCSALCASACAIIATLSTPDS